MELWSCLKDWKHLGVFKSTGLFHYSFHLKPQQCQESPFCLFLEAPVRSGKDSNVCELENMRGPGNDSNIFLFLSFCCGSQ